MDSPARPSQAKMASSTGGTEGSSPASSPASAASIAAMAAPKFGTLVPNRIFVGGISASTSEAELAQVFSAYGNVKATKIIADRGGVSKGYGFVTFETEEEAKRLQQESECIILRERKLNIAPAIKKQPFNRSFDGGTGSPPAVPTSTYYYTNGMGIPYQNGMTFYNAGAPTPGAAIAPPADPATLYQAAGVFGPQATASHQTFAPMMYPVPAPSLYMPQQYQYSPMPYEPYFPGTTAAASAPQYLYASNGAQATTSGSGNGSGNSNSNAASAGGGAAGAGSPASLGGPSPPQFHTHFYGPAGAASHHPAGAMASNPHAPPPPPPQIEHLYYSYPPPPHAAQPPSHHPGPLTLAADQQLLIYSTDLTGQSAVNDSQISQQEETRSSSSHSEQLQQATGGTATSDSGGGGGGGGGTQSNASGQPLSDPPAMLPLMPFKYPLSNRYANFHPVTMHSAATLPHQTQNHSPHQQTTTTTGAASSNTANDNNAMSDEASTTGAPVHYRTMPIYPTSLYIPHGSPYTTAAGPGNAGGGGSLLPTPPQQPYDLSGVAAAKYRDYSKAGLVNGSYKTGPPPHGGSPLIHHSAYVKQYNGPPLQPGPHHGLTAHQKYPRVTTPPSRVSYGKRNVANQQHHLASPTYYFPQKMSGQYGTTQRSGQQFMYGGQPPQLSAYAMAAHTAGNLHKSFVLGGGYENANDRRSVNSEHGDVVYSGRQTRIKSAMVNSYRGSNLTMSANASTTSNNVDTSNASSSPSSSSGSKPQQQPQQESVKAAEPSSEAKTTVTTTTATTTTTSNNSTISSSSNTATTETETSAKNSSSDNTASPPPVSHSPQTRPHPNVSPSPNPNQVQQLFGPGSGGGGGSQRYNTSSGSHQQRAGSANRYSMSSSAANRGGGSKSSSVMRQNSGSGSGNKFKMNGIVQTSGKLVVDEGGNLGGAGDAPSVVVGRLPLTPPTTPQQTSSGDQQLNESCHQMQSLVL